jgi:4-hydroxy-tetrahydrodipicolinate synthase
MRMSGEDMSGLANVIEGVIVPLLTPVDENERVDEPALRALIRHCLEGGVNGVFVGGSAGMGPLLTDDQWLRLMEITRDEVDDPVPLLGGVMATSTGRAIERIKILARAGFHHVVVTPTYYIIPTRHEEFMAHFDGCRQATDMNMVVYNTPSCIGAAIPVSAIVEMVKQGWTRTIKESSGDRDYFSDVLESTADLDTTVLQGQETDIAWALAAGAKGFIPACANCVPGLFTALWRAHKAGDDVQRAEAQELITAVREALILGDKNWIAGLMHGLKALGIGRGNALRPIAHISDEEKRKVEAIIAVQGT